MFDISTNKFKKEKLSIDDFSFTLLTGDILKESGTQMDIKDSQSAVLVFNEKSENLSVEPVAIITTNEFNEIDNFKISEEYKGCGLVLPIFQEAADIMNTSVIKLEKEDKISKKLCESIGFFEEYSDENTSYMVLPEYMLELFLESEEEVTYYVRDYIYPIVHNTLSTPVGDRKFKRLVEQFVDRNSVRLHEPCPISQIPFMDSDKKNFMECFNITEAELIKPIKQMTNSVSSKANFKLIHQNPIFSLLYCVIRYYTLNKDEKGLYASLVIYALASYPSVFDKYFKHGANKGVMLYTADKLTNKFIIKQKGHVYGALTESIRSSYGFLKDAFKDGSDREVIRFIQRIRNDQNSMLKKISSEYYENYKKGLSIYTTTDSYDDNNFVDDVSNNTAIVQDTAQKIVTSLITNGIDLQRAETAAKWAQISIVDCRYYLNLIVTKENVNDLNKFIESVLFIYLYDEHHQPNEIRSKEFLSYAIRLFRKTNSNDANVKRINTLLNKWAENSGIYTRYKREASRINYKKGIFWYIILCIQKYV